MSAAEKIEVSCTPGMTLPGGLIYCGVSPSTGKPFASRKLPENSLTLNFWRAHQYAVSLAANDRPAGSFRLATSAEIVLMRDPKTAGHDHFRALRETVFWTFETKTHLFAWTIRPSSGHVDYLLKTHPCPLKLVCDI